MAWQQSKLKRLSQKIILAKFNIWGTLRRFTQISSDLNGKYYGEVSFVRNTFVQNAFSAT
jgi:hypothetical protein